MTLNDITTNLFGIELPQEIENLISDKVDELELSQIEHQRQLNQLSDEFGRISGLENYWINYKKRTNVTKDYAEKQLIKLREDKERVSKKIIAILEFY